MLKLTLQQIMDLLDSQTEYYVGKDREGLVKACNVLYDHVNRPMQSAKKKTKKK
jgi:hypothetical protein